MKRPFSGYFDKLKLPKFSFPLKRDKKSHPQLFCGLDVGSHSVKWVGIQNSGKGELTAFAIVPIKKEKGREGIVAAIREAAHPSGSSIQHVHSAIGGQSVIIRYVSFPKMTREELRSHIEVEADKYIPFNIKEVVLDCQILEERKEEGKIHALVVAAKKEAVNHHLLLLREAGIEVEALDVDTFAVVNAFEHFLGTPSQPRCLALLDIGAKSANLSVLQGTTSLFSRDIPVGGTDFTLAISEKLNIETDEAEMVKCSGTKPQEELLSWVAAPLDNLMGEVKLSFDYFENQYDKRVERVYLSGGSSRLAGLSEFTQKNLNIETVFWNPLEKVTVPPGQNVSKLRAVGGGLAVAVGLAVRGIP